MVWNSQTVKNGNLVDYGKRLFIALPDAATNQITNLIKNIVSNMNKSNFKMDHVERLTKGKRSGKNIGSRGVGHHLRAFEREIYERALDDGFLVIDERSRENLWNVWQKVGQARGCPAYILLKNTNAAIGEIYNGEELIFTGELSKAKKEIRRLVN